MFVKHDCDKCDMKGKCSMERPINILRDVLRREGLAGCCTAAVTMMNDTNIAHAPTLFTAMISLAHETHDPMKFINTFIVAASTGFKEPALIQELALQHFEAVASKLRKHLNQQIQVVGAAFGFQVTVHDASTGTMQEEQKLDNKQAGTVQQFDLSNFQGTKQ